MIYASNRLKHTFLVTIVALVTFNQTNTVQLPHCVQSYRSAIKQRTLFAKVIFKALWKFGAQGHNYTLVEQKLAKAYNIALSPFYTVEEAVTELSQALKNSHW